MQFTFETQGTSSFLVYEFSREDKIDSMTMGMVGNNRIEGILPFGFTQLDSRRYLRYNISSKISLEQYFCGMVNKKRLLGVMESIASAVSGAQEYMIEPGSFIWDKNYIYVDVSSARAQMVCLPLVRDTSADVERFFKDLILGVQFDQSEDCGYVARLLGFFNANANFSLAEFLRLLKELSAAPGAGAPGSSVQGTPVREPLPAVPAFAAVQMPQVQGVPVEPVQPVMANSQNLSPQPMGAGPFPGEGVSASAAAADGMNMGVMPEGYAPAGGVPTAGPGGAKPKKAKKEKKGFSLFGPKKEKKQKSEPVKLPGRTKANLNPQGLGAQPAGGVRMPGMGTPMQMPGQSSLSPQQALQAQPPSQMQPPQMQQPSQARQQARPPVNGAAYGGGQGSAEASSGMGAGGQGIGSAYVPPVFQTEAGSFGGTVVLNAGNKNQGTVVLNADNAPSPSKPVFYVLRLKNGQRVPITKGILKLGSDASYVDFSVADNRAVSRSHADIRVKGSNVYLVDNNSTNHTYLDGELLTPNVETPMCDGSRFKLADEEFEFHMS